MPENLRPGGILTLDISLSTGWTYAHPADERNLAGGVWKLGTIYEKKTHAQQLGMLARALLNHIETALYEYAPARVVFESPISKAQTTDRLLKYLCAAVEIACFDAGVRCFEVAAPTARALVLGRGTFQKPLRGQGKVVMRAPRGKTEKQSMVVGDAKEEVALWCQEFGYQPVDDNHADSIVLWRYALAMSRSKATGRASV
jgi:hypothetical protein